jgi:hypothetical protein
MNSKKMRNAIGSNESALMYLNAETTRATLELIAKAKSLGKVPKTILEIELLANRYIAGVNAINELPRKAPNKQRGKLNEIFEQYREQLEQLKNETGYDLNNEETWG